MVQLQRLLKRLMWKTFSTDCKDSKCSPIFTEKKADANVSLFRKQERLKLFRK